MAGAIYRERLGQKTLGDFGVRGRFSASLLVKRFSAVKPSILLLSLSITADIQPW